MLLTIERFARLPPPPPPLSLAHTPPAKKKKKKNSLAAWPLISASSHGVDVGPVSYSGFATSNLDVPLAALGRAALVGALALAGARAAAALDDAGSEQQHADETEAPLLPNGTTTAARDSEDDDEDDGDDDDDGRRPTQQQQQQQQRRRRRQDQLLRRRRRWGRRGADAVSVLSLLALTAKAVAAAIAAPDGLWWRQVHEEHPSSSPSSSSSFFFCGLAPLYASLAASMVGAAAGGLLARAAVGKGPARPPSSSSSASAAKADAEPPATAADTTSSTTATTATARQTLRELARLSRPDAPILALAFAAGAVAAFASAAVPMYTGRVIDRASIEPDRRELLRQTLLLVAVGALGGAFTGIRGSLFTLAMTRLNVRLRARLFASLLAQDAAFFDTTPTGELTSRLAADCESVSNSVALNLNVAFRSVLQAAVVLIFMFAASWRLSVVTLAIVPAALALSQLYAAFYHRLAKRVQAALAEANALAEESLGAVATVRAHGAAGAAADAYGAKLAAFARLENRAAGAYLLNATAVTFLPVVSAAGVLYFGGTLVLAGEMSAGALVSYMLYQTSLASSFSTLGDVASALASAVGAAAKVTELLRRAPAMPPAGGFVPPGGASLEGSVELRGVHFAYPARPSAPVLRGLSVSIAPGGTLALVGPSGGGKSSVLKLVQRLYLPSRGRVLLDGRDVGAYDDAWMRRQVAVVSQTPVLFRRSVRENIVFGLPPPLLQGGAGGGGGGGGGGEGAGAGDEDDPVVAAAKAANAHDFISAFPRGYDTCVGGRGATVSGGQCARIAIARALVRRPRVLLLDEATAALDAESEGAVQQALDAVMASHGCTVIMVAHRLSTVVGATKIAVVSGGVVVEEGGHEELVRRGPAGGAYAALVARQLRGGASSAALLLSAGSGGGGGGGGDGAEG